MLFPSRNLHIGLSQTFPKYGTADSYTVWDNKCLQRFRRSMLPPSSGQLNLAQTNRSDWPKSLQYSYIIKKIPLPNHFSIHLRQIRAPKRWWNRVLPKRRKEHILRCARTRKTVMWVALAVRFVPCYWLSLDTQWSVDLLVLQCSHLTFKMKTARTSEKSTAHLYTVSLPPKQVQHHHILTDRWGHGSATSVVQY